MKLDITNKRRDIRCQKGADSMADMIILIIVAIAAAAGIVAAVKHFRGEGGCCGGGAYNVKPRKLKQVAAVRTFTVEGMSCQHCVNRVTEAVQNIQCTSAVVSLKKGTVRVSMAQPVPDEEIKAAIERAGYIVTNVE